MAKKKDHDTIEELDQVGVALSKSELFIEKYQKQLLIGIGAIVLIVLLVLGFKSLYLNPRIEAASNAIYKAQAYFAVDSFKLALNGDGSAGMMGFKDIASEYSITPSGKVAKAYEGICYYKLGDYKNAVKYLSQYDGDDDYLKTSVIGLAGDAYAEMGDAEKAFDMYKKAVSNDNELTPLYLKKAGVLYETKGNKTEALKMYNEIKDKYPASLQARDIEKYIARVD